MMMSVIFRSLSSSRWARTPALKKILLWPIRKRLPSSSRAWIYQIHSEIWGGKMAAQGLKGNNNKKKEVRVFQDLTILSQACLPSIKPLGMALGVRISYLEVEQQQRIIVKLTVAAQSFKRAWKTLFRWWWRTKGYLWALVQKNLFPFKTLPIPCCWDYSKYVI